MGNDKHCVCGFPDERGFPFFPAIWSGRNAMHLGFKFIMRERERGWNLLECIQCFTILVSSSRNIRFFCKIDLGIEKVPQGGKKREYFSLYVE